MKRFLVFVLTVFFLSKCEKTGTRASCAMPAEIKTASDTLIPPGKIDKRKEVPVLCYHNFMENTSTDVTLSRNAFDEQIRSLSDSGYHTILPDQLYQYLTRGTSLPAMPIMISFDDTRLAQYTIAVPILERYGFRGVFFIMTVCVNKPNYMSSTMINDLAGRGHVIGVHTYDHPNVNDIQSNQWWMEIKEPKIFLENVIHNNVDYFAYPYGPWTSNCIAQLKKYKYKAAFQLDGKQRGRDSLYTIRRLMVQGHWSVSKLHEKIAKTFY